jgi:peptidoglycan/LPS O-acetylase OafA/YrhL
VTVLFATALPGIFNWTKNSRILNFLGDLSFPVYLLHVLVLVTVFDAYADNIIAVLPASPPLAGVLLTLMYAGAVILASALAHMVVERPTERRLRSVLKSLFSVGRAERRIEADT